MWETIYEKNADVWGTSPHTLAVLLAARLSRGAVVADLGCGSGRDCHYLANLGFRSIGIDASVKAIEASRHRGCTSAVFVQRDLVEFLQHSREATYDAILSVNALNYLADDFAKAISAIRAALRPGGLFFTSVFASDDEEFKRGKLLGHNEYECDGRRVQLFTERDVRSCLATFCGVRMWNDSYVDMPHLGAGFAHRNSCWRVTAIRRGESSSDG